MRIFAVIFLLSSFMTSTILAFEDENENYSIPADVTYLVADLKYNEEQGVQICEIQQGRASRYIGIDYVYEQNGFIAKNFAVVMKRYHQKGWFLRNDIRDPHTADALTAIGWRGFENLEELLEDEDFILSASEPVCSLASVSDYSGVLFARYSSLRPYDEFRKKYPNIIILDEATLGYCGDKLKSSLLFTDLSIEKFKPTWNLYKKIYSNNLANMIAEDMGTDLVVIKPRRAAKGYGVIVCSTQELDNTLQYILTGGELLLEDPDPSYRYWAFDNSLSFIVEAYSPSTPTPVAHLEDRYFDPTMRVVYVLVHSDHQIHLHCLGSYWKLPEMSLDQEGNLNDLHKSCGKIPYFSEVEPSVDDEVQEQVRECFHQLYEIMLESRLPSFRNAA